MTNDDNTKEVTDMEVPIARMRDAMEMCQKIIPLMNNDEMNKLGNVLIEVTNRLIEEDRVTS